MSVRSLLAVLVLAAAVSPALADDEPRPRTVSVSGQAEVSAQPDMAYLTLGVEARRPTLQEARSEVTRAVEAVLNLTRELKIDPKYVNATRIQVQPEYSWNDKERTRRLLGYVVSRQIEVELRDLEKLGALLEGAVNLGVNQVGDPLLDSSRRKELERDALAKAVEDARLNAETVARAAGAKLGPVRNLASSSAPPVIPMYKNRMMAADAMAAAPAPEATYATGEMKFSSTVTAEFDLVP